MLQTSLDLTAEIDELYIFLKTLDQNTWSTPTPFMDWTPWDVVSHLHLFDQLSLLSLENRDVFKARAKEIMDRYNSGIGFKEQTRALYKDISSDVLLIRWHTTSASLAEQLGKLDIKRRLPWFGPDMSVKSFISARLMETWAHGQEVYDLMNIQRSYTDRIKHIALLGVRTFGWTFANRQLDVPTDVPYVCLTAPSGDIWEWNKLSDNGSVIGSAVDFCHVVTQGRNIEDCSLAVTGDIAVQWMSMAQCFAGPTANPPKPGQRTSIPVAFEM